jgi:phospholipid transport system transporter-binding protein
MNEVIRISGELTLDTVARRCDELASRLDGAPLTLDFSGVTAADSSSLTLLLCWLRQARQRQVGLTLTALPESMQQLIDVYDLRELLLPAKP